MSAIRRILIALLIVEAFSLVRVAAAPAKQVVILSWDGAPDWVVDRLLKEGKLPNVARLAKQGVSADYSTPAYPSITACGHAAIWTGAYGDVNGIVGNEVPLLPRSAHTLLENRSGFNSASLLAEPIWETAVKAGRRVALLSATQSFPPDPTLKRLRDAKADTSKFRSFSGFESSIQGSRVITRQDWRPAEDWSPLPPHKGTPLETVTKVGEQTFYLLIYDDPKDPKDGYDTLLICAGGKYGSQAAATLLKPASPADNITHWSPPLRVTKGDLFGYVYFRLFALPPDGKRLILYQRAVNSVRGASTKQEREEYLTAYGGFYDSNFGAYSEGKFGKTLWQGGDGTAESAILELVRLDVEFLKRGTAYALKRWKPDLLLHYAPMTDGAGHTWMGVLDPDSPRYQPEIAKKIMPFYEKVFQLQDEWLGVTLDSVGKEGVVCLVSDHGMAGTGKSFAPNGVLKKAGLLDTDAQGNTDLAKTKICAPNFGGMFLNVNGTDWKGGIVSPQEREGVLQKATQALLSAIDPETGQHPVTAVFRPTETVGMGMGGLAGGDLYFSLAPGYNQGDDADPNLVKPDLSPIGGGDHGFLPSLRKMQAIYYMSGEGLKSGVTVGGVRQIDIAPTLCRLLGIPAPANAKGHCIGEALK